MAEPTIRLLKNLFGFVLMVGLLMVLVGFFLPGKVELSAETTVGAPKELVFEHLNSNANNQISWKDSGLSGVRIIHSSPTDSLSTETSVGKDYTAFISYNLASKQDSVKVKSTVLVELGMNPISRYYGLMLDARFGNMIHKNLKEMKSTCETLHKKG